MNDFVVLELNVQAGAKKDQIAAFFEPNILKLKIREKAIENKANIYLIAFLAEQFSLKKIDIKIISGLKSKKKLVKINNLTIIKLREYLRS